ncbi:MAG: hypothetical protein Q9M32_04585 [Sulfurimonas sp.]|nr:hypothetical protein [Sulfurimonas sp.]MDQ7060768.1 hypothetical protein [Sulfurimonas sp.]
MPNTQDSKNLINIVISIIALASIALFIYFLVIPVSTELIATHFTPGVGFKSAAVYSFFVTIALVILFAFAGGDGLFGEIQYMFAAFFTLFFAIWMFITWIF